MRKSGEVSNAARYSAVLTKIKKHRGEEELFFQEVDVKFLDEFQQYLKSLQNTQNTIHSNLRVIRAIVYRAISIGLVKNENNPFLNYKLKPGVVNKVRLTEEEISRIEALKLEENSLIWHVKNAFLFSYYCAGIRISDILLIRWKNIVGERLVFIMHKTKQGQSIKILDKPNRILNNYKEDSHSEKFIFPFFDNSIDYTDADILRREIGRKTALVNKYLKKIGELAKIEKKITTHTARHSFADIARQKTNNLYNLSKTLGHSSLKITEAYLASFDEKAVDDTLDEVFK
jgi:integrase